MCLSDVCVAGGRTKQHQLQLAGAGKGRVWGGSS